MLDRIAAHQTQEIRVAPVAIRAPEVAENTHSDEELTTAERRRQMYERIARGNALAEAEDHARRKWQGR